MRTTELLTTDEVLTYLRITRRTIYRLVKAQAIPVLRVGHQWRFRRKEIDAWMRSSGHMANQAGLRRVAVVKRTTRSKSA